jgi:sarcosine oxidase subunit gamma
MVTLLWQGPDSWLIVAPANRISAVVSELRTSLAGMHAAVTDVSSGTTVLRVAGPNARDLLYKGCFIDLDPPAFTAGRCAATRIAAFAATIHQVDDEPAYDLYVARSMALAFSEWLVDAGHEYGIAKRMG